MVTANAQACPLDKSNNSLDGGVVPTVRSATVLVADTRKELLLVGGETLNGQTQEVVRSAEVWRLGAPGGGWEQCSCPAPRWQGPWQCGAVANESVPTPRSNHCAIACGELLLVFGGWAADGHTPLAAPELLHLETRCWTHCSTVNEAPQARGNPTMVYSPSRHLAIMYGGWDGHERFSDVWCLDLESWRWLRAGETNDKGDDSAEGRRPAPRTDHTSVLWQMSSQHEYMITFGGSLITGSSADLWALDCSSGEPASWIWEMMEVADGPAPPPRTSHASAIAGIGDGAALVVVGGQDSKRGTGMAAVLADAWILGPLGSPEKYWTRLDWEGIYPLQRCRHCMIVVNEENGSNALAIVYGGYDGVSTIDEHHSLFVAPLPPFANDSKLKAIRNPTFAAERWEADLPVTVEDLTEDEKAQAHKSRRPLALAKMLHRYAMKQAPPRDTYIDPGTGYSVFTQAYLKRRPCCGNGCRHCPHGHVNVPANNRKALQAIDW